MSAIEINRETRNRHNSQREREQEAMQAAVNSNMPGPHADLTC